MIERIEIIKQERKVHLAQQAHLVVTGATGATGEPGATGATGATGEPGLQNINASNYYSVPGRNKSR